MSKAITVFFSAGGVTKNAASIIAKTLDTELFEIMPKVPYTKDDLNWRSRTSRSTVEMSDKSSRPEVSDPKIDLTGVDTVFLGFPMWWYVAPTIINTFLEANDLSGKKIILFATSGGSGFGKTAEFLKNSISPSAELIEGRVFSGTSDPDEIERWARQYKNDR